MPIRFRPPKNLQYFLLILKDMKKIRGRIKLFKIHYLIEREGHVKYDRSIKNYPLGPVDYSSFDYCSANGLINENLVTATPYDYYEISITEKGEEFFDKHCRPLMKEKELESARGIIKKYRNMWGKTILKYVHKKYVDPFKDAEWINKVIMDYQGRNSIIFDLAQKKLEVAEDEDRQQVLLGQLHHIEKILNKIKHHSDPVNIGNVLWTIYEFHKSLETSRYISNPYTDELFEFLDNYCEKEGIHQSIASDDFSDIPKEERERLFQAVARLKIPPSL